MRVFIAVDLEGICGVVGEQQTEPEGPLYGDACRAMRADLDAVLAGCAAAGVAAAVVCDAHYHGMNLSAEALPPWVTLVSGSGPHSMLQGIGPGFDAALFVGYHARAGTGGAVLEHTWTYKVFAVHCAELELGEFGLGALLGGHVGVPAVFVSGDDKVAAEAAALVPGITTTAVKTGVTRTCAALCPPDEARARLRADVERALTSPPPAPLVWSGAPLRLAFTRVPFCDAASQLPGARRLDGRTVELSGADFEQLYLGFLACLDLAATVD